MDGLNLNLRYAIVEKGQAIKCLTCNMTSWSQADVKHKFCGKCGTFHEDEGLREYWNRQAGEIDLAQALVDIIKGQDPGV